MTFSIFESIKNVRKDEHWFEKTYIIGLFSILSSVLLKLDSFYKNKSVLLAIFFVIVGILAYLYMYGYNYKTLNKYLNSDENKLAELGEKNLILLGFKTVLCFIAYYIALMIPLVIVAFVVGIVVVLLLGLLFLILHDSVLFKILSILLGTAFYIFVLAYATIASSAMLTYYGTDLDIKKIFAFKTHFKIVKEHHSQCWSLFGKFILWGLLSILVLIITVCSVIGLIFLPMVIGYTSFVWFNLLSQFGKTIEIHNYC